MFFAFLAMGMAAAWRLLPAAPKQVRLWLGAVAGLMAMMWLPSLFAFFVDFTALAQYLALGTGALMAGMCLFLGRRAGEGPQGARQGPPLALTLGLVIPFLILAAYLQYTHTLKNVDGALYVGQSTYGDLCLHLGIATGLRGASYPPEYTLLPGTLLGYPFLFDALSASMLTLGSALAPAFILPGAVAMGLVFWGFVLLAWEMTGDKLAVAVSFLLVFLNGGLGFLYMLDGWPSDDTMLREIFSGFYRTPTNLPDLNLRWVNVICDLMIPQRTILAGWMTVLPALYLLCRGLKTGGRSCFVALGLWAGAMPMIHTHSFLALGLISAGCMAWQLVANRPRAMDIDSGRRFRQVLDNYLIYGGIALLLALPQLITWTFPQSMGSGQLSPRFNWVNTRDDGSMIDGYFWFWIKNVGLPYLLMVPAALNAPKRLKPLALGALVVYAAAELYQFQTNVYDNNKLFYVAFLLMMPLVGRLMSALWARMKDVRGRWMIALPVMVVCLLSGALTVGREAVSQYQLFSAQEARAAAYIDENAPAEAIFLTGGQHNNPVAALAGRRLVCGTGTYLYFHGVDYSRQQEAARLMYEAPRENQALFEEYGVNYIYISSYERSDYDLDEEALRAMFPVWYEEGSVTILKTP